MNHKNVFSRVLRDSTPRFVGPSVRPSVRPSVGPSHFRKKTREIIIFEQISIRGGLLDFLNAS